MNLVNDFMEYLEMTDLNGIDSTLTARGSRYGDFKDNAAIGDKLLEVMMGRAYSSYVAGELNYVPTNWDRLDPVKRQGLMLIAQKLARALSPSGDPEYKDNWHDIQGYAKLIEDRCKDAYPTPCLKRNPAQDLAQASDQRHHNPSDRHHPTSRLR